MELEPKYIAMINQLRMVNSEEEVGNFLKAVMMHDLAKEHHLNNQQSTVNVEELKGKFYNDIQFGKVGFKVDDIFNWFLPHLQPQQKQCDAVDNKYKKAQKEIELENSFLKQFDEFEEWLSASGYIRDPFPQKDFDDDIIRHTHIDTFQSFSSKQLYHQFLKTKTNDIQGK